MPAAPTRAQALGARVLVFCDLYLSGFVRRYVWKPAEWQQKSWWWKTCYVLTRVTVVSNLWSIVTLTCALLFTTRANLPTMLDQASLLLTIVFTIVLVFVIERDVRRRAAAATLAQQEAAARRLRQRAAEAQRARIG